MELHVTRQTWSEVCRNLETLDSWAGKFPYRNLTQNLWSVVGRGEADKATNRLKRWVWSICYFGVSECLPGSFRLVKNRTGAPRGCDSYIQLAGERSLGQARATIPLWGCIRKGIQRKSAKSNHLLWNLLWQRISRTSFKLLTVWQKTLEGAETSKSTS